MLFVGMDFVESINLPVSKVWHFSHSMFSYTKVTLAPSKFKRKKLLLNSKNQLWCFDLAYFDKQAKLHNHVEYLPVLPHLIDRTVDAKLIEKKDSVDKFCAFLTKLIIKNFSKNFGCTGEQNLLVSVKNFAKPEEYKFTLQGLKQRLHLLNVHYDSWKKHFTVTRKIMHTNSFKKCLNTLQPWTPKNCSIDLIPKNIK